MSETPQKTKPARPSLRKPQPASDVPKRLPIPRTVDYACVALAVAAAGLVVRGLTMLGGTSELKAYLIKANNNAGSKKQANYVTDHLSNDLHALREYGLFMGVLVAAAVAMLIFALRRTRTASGSRWAMLVVMVLTQMPFSVIPVTGFPVIPKVAGVIVGVASILAIVAVFLLKPSQQYFRDCKEAALPPERRGQPRPSLFGPRRPRPGLAGPGGRAAADRANSRTTSVRATGTDDRPGAAGKARAKVRSDSEAVARGADLARSRAKASKSRRTPD